MKLTIILATAAYATACTNVSVEGDATYCIEGAVCGGNGSACPKKGDWASGDCKTGLFSSKNGWCQAPESAVCLTLKTGARGCVYPSKGPQKMVAGMTAEAEQACTNVSVEGDATYCVNGPVCSGNSGSGACPKKGDWASGDCKTGLFSSNGKWCQAPEDATCQKLKTGAYGCVYPSKGPQKMAVEAEQGCTNVSVEGDATYCVNGPVCSGNSGGGACPKQGDWASGDCKTGLFSSKNGWCQAPETATCQKLKTGAWGCVYPSKGPQKMDFNLRG